MLVVGPPMFQDIQQCTFKQPFQEMVLADGLKSKKVRTSQLCEVGGEFLDRNSCLSNCHLGWMSTMT